MAQLWRSKSFEFPTDLLAVDRRYLLDSNGVKRCSKNYQEKDRLGCLQGGIHTFLVQSIDWRKRTTWKVYALCDFHAKELRHTAGVCELNEEEVIILSIMDS